jgi:ferredoxin
MARVGVDLRRCEATGFCAQVAPELFSLDDEGYSTAIDRELDEREARDAEEAADMCPVRAVEVIG